MTRERRNQRVGWGPRTLLALMAGLAGLGALASAGTATAATYTVESCTDAAHPGISGWRPVTVGSYVSAVSDCSTGGTFGGSLQGDIEHAENQYAAYVFDAPSSTSLAGLRGLRTSASGPFRAYGNASARLLASGAVIDDCQRFYGCQTNPEAPVSFDLAGASNVQFGAYCTGAAGCPAGSTFYNLRRIRLDLNDETNPVITDKPSGTLTSAENTDRLRTLTYSASDRGGGLFRERLIVDDVAVRDSVVNGNGGKCAVPFRDPVPCRTSPTSSNIDLDTSSLTDGPHTVRLAVRDATDVNEVMTAPWTITVNRAAAGSAGGGGSSPGSAGDLNTVAAVTNPVTEPVANGVPSTSDALLSARFVVGAGKALRTTTRVVAAYGQKLRVRGTLQTPAGRPITGARVYLVQKALKASEKSWRLNKAAVTGADGSFTLPVVGNGRSRDIRVVYFPQGGSNANRGSNALTLQVRQDATFQVSKRRLRNGNRLIFRGRVLGTIPTSGVDVRVQVRLNRSWFTFAKAKTTRSTGGRFQAAHRFTETTRATTYRFRVLVLPRNRTLNTSGFSPHIDVRVLP